MQMSQAEREKKIKEKMQALNIASVSKLLLMKFKAMEFKFVYKEVCS